MMASRRLVLLALPVMIVSALAYWQWQQAGPTPATVTTVASTNTGAEAAEQTTAAEIASDSIATKIDERVPAENPRPAAYRASAAQRADDRQRLDSELDLPAFVAELRARANAGDADAAQMLAELYQECAGSLAKADRPAATEAQMRDMLTNFFGLDQLESDAMMAVVELSAQRCASLSLVTSADAAALGEAWRARALQLGHPAAVLAMDRQQVPPDAPDTLAGRERARLAGIELLLQGQPMDLARYSMNLAGVSRYNNDAFLMAACELLANCAEDPDAYGLAQLSGRPSGVEQWAFLTLSRLSPRARTIAEVQSAEIVRLWRQSRPDLILAPTHASSRGGGG